MKKKKNVYKKGLVIAATLVLVGGILIPTINAAKPAGADDDWDYWTNSPHVMLNTTGNVSIGAGTSPVAKLQVGDGTVLFNGSTGGTPVSGAGTRLMWIPSQAAFRAGYVSSTQWDDTNIGTYSMATGYGTTASGNYGATAMGLFTTASGIWGATAMGRSTTASGDYGATAMGDGTTASGNSATAMGRSTNASGSRSTAMGDGTTASGDSATAMGYGTTASGDSATAMGRYTSASGYQSTAMGRSTTASGTYATAMGRLTTASGYTSTAMGSTINVSGNYSVGIGLDYNWPITWNVTSDHVMSVMGGNVGIGTTSPSAKLEVENGAVLFAGTTGGTPVSGAGTRLMWIPAKSAFRAGYVDGSQWDDTNIGTYSTATGYSTTASGTYATAMGRGTTASGWYSTALGQSTSANNHYATAMGVGTTASGESSTAMGTTSTASGWYGTTAMGCATNAVGWYGATAMGRETMAWGDSSTAMGYQTNASGNIATAMGFQTTASGSYATAMGRGTTASGGDSTAMGRGTTASGWYSTAMGRDTVASGESSTAMGTTSTASGQYGTTAIGCATNAVGWYGATAMGRETMAWGDSSTAMGCQTNASGNTATAMGESTTASGNWSTAMGRTITVPGENSVGIGLNSTAYTVSDSNVLSVMGGRVGIGTVSPDANYSMEIQGNPKGLYVKTADNTYQSIIGQCHHQYRPAGFVLENRYPASASFPKGVMMRFKGMDTNGVMQEYLAFIAEYVTRTAGAIDGDCWIRPVKNGGANWAFRFTHDGKLLIKDGGSASDVPSANLHVVGDIYCTGKLTSDGGNDPPYVLYNYETRHAIIERVAEEVPENKQGGAVLFWNGETSQFEVYLPSQGEFQDILGNILE